MTRICIENISLTYIKHVNKPNSLKESVIKYLLNFGKSFYTSENLLVLDDISFELNEGDRLGIIGVNGAGKSTLLKVITGIYQPSKGKIKIDGRISSLIEIGAGFDPELTGRENIYLNGLISGFSKKEISAKLDEIIEFSGLAEFIDSPIKYYSTGMGLRLGFSISTSINPEILICDELFAGGDINFIEKATVKLNQIIDQAHIFITVSHDNDYIRKFCNKVLYLKNCHVEYFGPDIEYAITKYIDDNKTKSIGN
ncbi:MAG: ABC transporter ATP-binding protein [Gammaproteobacteria bacterium]|nr:ABC transporter ATP-binding protein [Gammaproteobacteria bacterium]